MYFVSLFVTICWYGVCSKNASVKCIYIFPFIGISSGMFTEVYLYVSLFLSIKATVPVLL